MKNLIMLLLGLCAVQAVGQTQEKTMTTETALATFAGGCFWCMESPFQKLDGVVAVVSGYIGGTVENPSYEQVSTGKTGHFEAVQVRYQPAKISYQQLLQVYWQQIDPTDAGGSFHDRGSQYRSAVFYHDAQQQALAQASINRLNKKKLFSRPVVTELLPYSQFYPAEDYHQDFSAKNPAHYQRYRHSSGRDAFIAKTWASADASWWADYQKPDVARLQQKLNPLQYRVTQEAATEPPFENEYWNHKKEGIYVDVVSGEPLFSSVDKYDSKTGWPSFSRTIAPDVLTQKTDHQLFRPRVEVRSRYADSHLGHVFDQESASPTGLRYCINSAALRFIPKEDLVEQGYGQYLPLFDQKANDE